MALSLEHASTFNVNMKIFQSCAPPPSIAYGQASNLIWALLHASIKTPYTLAITQILVPALTGNAGKLEPDVNYLHYRLRPLPTP